MSVTRAWVRALPKAELHVHLDGSLRPETLVALAERLGVRLPVSGAEALRHHLLVRDARNLEEYLSRYDVTLAVMQTAGALERIAAEFAEDVAADGTRYVEVRFCPALHPGVGPEAALEAVQAGLARGAAGRSLRTGIIVSGLRTLPPATSRELARLAVAWRDRGVVAFDLAGSEAGHPAVEHAEAFRLARAGGLHLTCHAGEGDGAGSIRQALEGCGAERLGHGVRLREDPALFAMVRERGVPLEMCPTSNVHTRTVTTLADHPLRAYLEAGLVVTLNTDSRLMDGITLVDEYCAVAEALGMDRPALVRLARNAIASAFVPPEVRAALFTDFERGIEDL